MKQKKNPRKTGVLAIIFSLLVLRKSGNRHVPTLDLRHLGLDIVENLVVSIDVILVLSLIAHVICFSARPIMAARLCKRESGTAFYVMPKDVESYGLVYPSAQAGRAFVRFFVDYTLVLAQLA